MKNVNELDKNKENLYSRQIGTYGEEAMKKILNLNILILGIKGLGIEVAKNIILTGPNSVFIYDNNICELRDMGTNYYLKKEDINKNRIDYSSFQFLSNLNPYTKVKILDVKQSDNLFDEISKNHFDVIVQTDIQSKNDTILFNEFCRKNNIKFIYGAVLGLSGFIFSDFGNNHIILDKYGIEPKRYLCLDIKNDDNNKSLVAVVNDFKNPLRLETGDYVIFKNIKGMTELNDNKPRVITINDDKSFYIEDDISKYKKYEGNGDIYEYKSPEKINHLSFQNNIALPFNRSSIKENFVEQDENKPNTNKLYFSIFLAIKEYLDDNNNDIYKLIATEEIEKIIERSEILFDRIIKNDKKIGIYHEGYDEKEIQHFDKKIAYNIIKYSQYKIIPICSILGGFISQEIIKTIGKYNPLNQWMFFNLYDPNFNYGNIIEKSKINNRYHDLVCIFGKEIQERLQKLNIFIAGAGAVGCELLKNLALLGISTEENSLLTVTDYDNIEISNLNRQFLFNNKNIGQSKSIIACNETKKMNNDIRCCGKNYKICKETENIFNEAFWKSQNIIISAVDSDETREYLNQKCFKYDKILINSGTSGVRGKANIIIPRITYPLQIEEEEDNADYPMCTIKFYPSKIEHCIEWSRSLFHELFFENIKIFNIFISNKDNFINNISEEPNEIFLEKYLIIRNIFNILNNDNEKQKTYKIIELAVQYFYRFYIKSIENLLLIYPNKKNTDGELFWSGEKKKPCPLKSLDTNDKMTIKFVSSFCNIFSNCLGLKLDDNYLEDNKLKLTVQKIFGVIENKNNNDKKNERKEQMNEMKNILIIVNSKNNINWEINEEIFNKDNYTHIEFIQSSANLRAKNYSIEEVNMNKALMIAGNIIASVPTSTSSIVGYISFQIINLMYTRDIQNVIKNAFLDLGSNTFDTIPQDYIEENEDFDSNYPIIEINQSKTCSEFLELMKNKYKIDVFHFEINGKILYDKRVTKVPHIIKRELERSKTKIEDLYFTQIKNSKENQEELNKKNFFIKIFCRINNEMTKEIEEIYNFPLIKYSIN